MRIEAPVVDLEDLLCHDPARQGPAARAVRDGFGELGLIYIRNHGVPPLEVLALYDDYLSLLERPEAEKRTWGGPEIWYQRGWTPPNTEQAVVAGGRPDFKECFFAAPIDLDPQCRRWFPEVYSANVWPHDADAFRDRYLALGRQIHRVGLTLLQGCARALDLPVELFDRLTDGAAHVTRLLKYLPLSEHQTGTGILWGEEHTDFNLLTLLPGGCFYRGRDRSGRPTSDSGLKLRTRPSESEPRGQQVPGRPPPGCMVAQVGQQLEVLTNGRFLATPHVITAPTEPGWSRTSLAHFIHLNAKERVAPVAQLEDPTNDAYAPPVLAGTYALKTLVDIGLAPRSSLDMLGYRHYGRLAAIRESEDE